MNLTATKNTLNLFEATGHFQYADSAHMYLQQMLKLPEKHPAVHKMFKENGYHSVRHSDKYWEGLWSDLIIEQVTMTSIKSRGGLIRGSCLTESTRHQWVHTAHQYAVIHETVTSTIKTNSEQHVELSVSRKNRDVSDLSRIQA